MTGEQMGFGFEQMAEEARTAHIPSAIEEAIPYYRNLIEKHHAAMLAADVETVMAIRKEAQDLAIKLNDGKMLGINGGEGSPVDLLEKATNAPTGQIPLWGQCGIFDIMVGSMPIRIEQDGMFGIGCAFGLWPGFSAHAIEPDKPFLSETGYRSFLDVHATLQKDITPERFAAEACRAYIEKGCKGKTRRVETSYADRIRAEMNERSADLQR